jgi:hypothetical protein
MSGAAKRLQQDSPSSSAAHTQFIETPSRSPDRTQGFLGNARLNASEARITGQSVADLIISMI